MGCCVGWNSPPGERTDRLKSNGRPPLRFQRLSADVLRRPRPPPVPVKDTACGALRVPDARQAPRRYKWPAQAQGWSGEGGGGVAGSCPVPTAQPALPPACRPSCQSKHCAAMAEVIARSGAAPGCAAGASSSRTRGPAPGTKAARD